MRPINYRAGFLLILSLALSPASFAAEPSFDGVWKVNLSKSQLSGQTFIIEKAASGKMRFDMHGFAYDYDFSGKEFPTPDGGTVSVLAPEPHINDITMRMNGKVIATMRFTVNGNKATTVMKAPKEDGAMVEQTTEFERVSGGPGVVGKWKSTDVKSAPMTLEIATTSPNGITIKMPEFKSVCTGSFDGKDYPVLTDGAVTKQTLAFQRTGPGAFKATTKIDGKPFYVEEFSLSEDGKTLTDNGNLATANEPIKAVYERQ